MRYGPETLLRSMPPKRKPRMSKKSIITASLAATAVCAPYASAADAPPPPPYTLSANVNLVSDYYFRGLTQTWGNPAIQGGFDFVHSSGFYVGTWASNVSGNQYAGGSMEWDFYGGYNYKLNDDFTLGAGLYYYYYPSANVKKSAAGGAPDETYDTGELNLSVSWKFLTFKWSYALTNYFGASKKTGYKDDTDGTMYFDLSATYPLPFWEGLSLVGHVGYTDFSSEVPPPGNHGETDPSYYDYKIGVTKTWEGGWNAGLFYVGASNDFWKDQVSVANVNPVKRDLNEGKLIVQVGRTF
jgi:uncharacterized protein (TIGR02001 family)